MAEISEYQTIFITEAEQNQRIDKILSDRFADQSRTYFQYLLENSLVLLNGEPVKKRVKPKIGDEVEIAFACTPEIDLQPEAMPLEIIYEDDYLLAVNKPAGMVVHPGAGNRSGTFVNGLLHYCQSIQQQWSGSHSIRPGIVHRLDKETSGLLLAAKDTMTQAKLVELFASRQVHKRYIAICCTNPGDTWVKEPIARHPTNRQQMAVVATGKESITHFVPVKVSSDLSMVYAYPQTGRTHQIRVHLQHLKCPILGDSIYGTLSLNQKYGIKRQMLHAEGLSFTHPVTKQVVSLSAPIPADMQSIIDKFALSFYSK
ncbi:MAG: putative pseudouridine synthase Cpar [Chlamydiales bacterium]|jgi:23S rRNA pseudouridine1911/1915/1917 synthase|nr:putative pseudouridine synthase Cpar [Chlamydiales bacterium]